MRRALRSTIAAFGVGLLWAGAGAVAMMAVHHTVAPPSPDATTASDHVKSVSADPVVGGVDRWKLPGVAGPALVSGPLEAARRPRAGEPREPTAKARETDQRALERTADIDAQRALTRAIQQELARVGCYSGSIDGAWSDGTRSAMTTFNRSVKTQLPTAAPDYILLTLLQGHDTKACGPGADRSTVAAASPAAPTGSRTEAARADGPRDGWTTNLVVGPTPAVRPAAKAAVAPVVVAAPQIVGQQRVLATTTTEPIGVPQAMAPQPQPFPGRMAIGVPVSPGAPAAAIGDDPLRRSAIPAALVPPAAAPQPDAQRRASASRPSQGASAPPPRRTAQAQPSSGSNGGARGQRVFQDVSRNAP